MIKPEHPALYSKRFSIRRDFLNRAASFSPEEICIYQSRTLRRLYKLAFSNSKYYKNLFSSNGLDLNSVKSIDDLSLLPISTKDNLKDAATNILTTKKSSFLTTRTTGGSTGNPLTVYGNPSFYSKDKANTYFYVNSFGHDIFTSKSVRLYGNKVTDSKGQQLLYQYNSSHLKLELNCYAINDKTIGLIFDQLLEHKPEYMHARSRAILSLTRQLEYQAFDGTKLNLKHIFVDGENISIEDQSYLENFYQIKLVNVYGHTEGSLFAFPCSGTSDFHYQPVTGILEIITNPHDYNLPDSYANTALVTGLNNFCMPFIRYATGDIVSQIVPSCSYCGHNYFTSAPIIGRSSEYVITNSNSQVALSSILYNYDDVDWSRVKYWQAYQDTPGILVVYINPLDGLSPLVNEQIRSSISESLNQLCNPFISVQVYISDLSPNARGKVSNFRQLLA